MKCLAFGEILFDIIEGEKFLGGAPLNFSAHLAQCGAESYILSRVGTDTLGNEAIKKSSDLNINVALIQKDQLYPTGTVKVSLNGGQPDYIINEDVAYDFISYSEAKEKLFKTEFDVFYYGTLAQRSKISRTSLFHILKDKKFTEVFYDVNLRKGYFSKEIIQESLAHCTILKLNDEEVITLGKLLFQKELSIEEFSKIVTENYSIKVVIVTAGASGCYIFKDSKLTFIKGYPVKVADTVGAGDSFSAAFLYHYIQNGDLIYAAGVANKLGSYVASQRGPIPEFTSEIKDILSNKVPI